MAIADNFTPENLIDGQNVAVTRKRIELSSIIFTLVVAVFLFEALAGILRSGLNLIAIYLNLPNVYALLYAPKLLALICILSFPLMRDRIPYGFLGVGLLLSMSVLNGFAHLPSIVQPLFGLWTLTPALLGATSAKYLYSENARYLPFFKILFFVVVSGIFLNHFINFPWAGVAVDFAGQSISASRQWTTEGISRISGFSRASFDAAAQALVLSIIIVANPGRAVFKCFVWIAAGLAITLTTSKGIVFAYLLISLYFLSDFILINFNTHLHKLGKYIWLSIILFLIGCDIVVPLTTLIMSYKLNLNSPLSSLLFGSLGDRLDVTWPLALSLLHSGWSWIWGNGIGAVGAAAEIFNTANYSSGDNVFVYLLVQYGIILSVGFLAYLWWKMLKMGQEYPHTFRSRVSVPTIIYVISYGMFAAFVEEPTSSFLLGLCLAGNTYRGFGKSPGGDSLPT